MSTTHNSTGSHDEFVVASGRGNIQYGQVPAWILLSQDAHACRVYAILSLFKNHETDVVYPGLDWIAGALGVTKTDSISRHIDKLVACGAVHRERGRSADGLRTRNRYTLHWLPPGDYDGPMSTRDVTKASKAKNTSASDQPPSTGDGTDQEEQASPQVTSNPPQEGYVPPSRGGSVPPSRGGLSKPKGSTPNESKPKKTPPVELDERSVREPAVRTPEDPIDEAPDFMRDAQRVAVEEVIAASAAENPPTVETTQGGDKNNPNPNPNRDIAGELLREAFAGVNTGDPQSADVKRKKLDLVDELTRKLDAGVPKRDVRERLGGLASTQSPIGVALYRVRNLTSVTGPSQPSPTPKWCGECDESTRMAETAESIPYRCPNCNPLAGEPRVSRSNGAEDALYRIRGIEAQRAKSKRIRDELQARKDERKAAEARLEAQKEAQKARESMSIES